MIGFGKHPDVFVVLWRVQDPVIRDREIDIHVFKVFYDFPDELVVKRIGIFVPVPVEIAYFRTARTNNNVDQIIDLPFFEQGVAYTVDITSCTESEQDACVMRVS